MQQCAQVLAMQYLVVFDLLLLTLCLTLWLPAQGCSSQTSGFSSLEELRRNGSLLERYSTHDGELRSLPGVTSTCSGPDGRISKITFIALPGAGAGKTLLLVNGVDGARKAEIVLTSASQTIGELGYELTLPTSVNVYFSERDALWIRHSPHGESGVRLLYQVGDVARNVCWSAEPVPESNCQYDYDFPLLSIETEPTSCITGLMTTSELKRVWESRALPTLYTSPEREITLNCTPASISRILVGAYPTMTGDRVPQIFIGSDQICKVSTEPVSEGVNVYECVLDSPVELDEDTTLILRQRNSTSQIVFLHDGQTDTPLISMALSEECSSSGQLLSETDLREMATLFVPNIIQREDDEIDFEHLKISQDFVLTHWTFVARTIGKGEEYPKLSLIIPEGLAYTQKHTENTNCTDTIYPNVYQCSVAPETVRAGDIVALVLPPLSRARVALVFILNGAQPGKRIVGGAQVEGFPLFALEIGSNPFLASQPCLPTPSSTVQLTISPTSTNIPEHFVPPSIPTAVDSSIRLVIAGVSSSLSVLIVLTAVALTVLLVLWLRRRKKRRESADATKNDLGSGGVTSGSRVVGIPVSDNPAYVDSRTNTLVYDYPRV